MKFNVDGSARGKPGPAGMGGILRDAQGMVRAKFYKALGIADSNVAEIREALVIFATSRWCADFCLLIESDSFNAISWLNSPESVPWRMKYISNHIKQLLTRLRCWKGNHVRREINTVMFAFSQIYLCLAVDRPGISLVCEWDVAYVLSIIVWALCFPGSLYGWVVIMGLDLLVV